MHYKHHNWHAQIDLSNLWTISALIYLQSRTKEFLRGKSFSGKVSFESCFEGRESVNVEMLQIKFGVMQGRDKYVWLWWFYKSMWCWCAVTDVLLLEKTEMELCLEKLKVELVSGDPPMTWMCLHMRHRAFIVIGSNKTKKVKGHSLLANTLDQV